MSKTPKPPEIRNWVAKHLPRAGCGTHLDKRRRETAIRGSKHKKAPESFDLRGFFVGVCVSR